jgi:hypothetical protein
MEQEQEGSWRLLLLLLLLFSSLHSTSSTSCGTWRAK